MTHPARDQGWLYTLCKTMRRSTWALLRYVLFVLGLMVIYWFYMSGQKVEGGGPSRNLPHPPRVFSINQAAVPVKDIVPVKVKDIKIMAETDKKEELVVPVRKEDTSDKPSGVTAEQEYIDYLSRHIEVKVEVISNFANPSQGRMTLRNGGDRAIEAEVRNKERKSTGTWGIFLCVNPYMEPMILKSRYFVFLGRNQQMKMSHPDGRLWKLEPADNFKSLRPGESIQLDFHYGGPMVARSDFFPNWYILSDGTTPRILLATAGESLDFVGKFTTPEQYKRNRADQSSPYTSEERYDQNSAVTDLGRSPQPVLPTPYSIKYESEETFDFSNPKLWHIVSDDVQQLQNEIKFFKSCTGLEFMASDKVDHFISLEIGTVSTGDENLDRQEEKYSISMSGSDRIIRIKAERPVGIYYGIRSFLMLINQDQHVPIVQITDAPRFEYRGLMLDVSRNFFPKDAIMELIDVMSLYKLNRLHFHLTDDQGWRLQIPGLPELTEVGGRRGHDLEELNSLSAFDGSGPFHNTSGSGFYSVTEFQEILRHAKNNHILIIPEFDMPAHCHAAVQSMKIRHDRLLANGAKEEVVEEYLLSDPRDRPTYQAVGLNRESALNPCRESTYKFVEKIFTEVKKIYQDADAPLPALHIGGDELPWQAYQNSPMCTKYKAEHPGIDTDTDLKFYFIKRVAEIAVKKKVKLQLWEDGVINPKTNELADLSGISTDDLIANAWQNTWEKGKGNRAYNLANKGVRIVLGHATHLYFDHPQEPDPEDRGLYWATRYIDTKRVYGFMPDSVYDNMDFDRSGKKINREEICQKFKDACLPLERPEMILGMQGALWTEVVRTPDQMFSQLFPRSLALAERAWHKDEWESEPDPDKRERMRDESWSRFTNVLGYQELQRLELPEYLPMRGFMRPQRYYLHPPGAVVDGSQIKVNTGIPGTVVQVHTSGSWSDVPGNSLQYSGESVQLRTRGPIKSGNPVISRVIEVGGERL